MNNLERLNYAEMKLDEAIRNGTTKDVAYWQGYRDGVMRALERERQQREKSHEE